MAKLMVWSTHDRLTPKPDQVVHQPLLRFWKTAILQRIAVHLLNSPRVDFDLEVTLGQLRFAPEPFALAQ
jgi:hypothetical protein